MAASSVRSVRRAAAEATRRDAETPAATAQRLASQRERQQHVRTQAQAAHLDAVRTVTPFHRGAISPSHQLDDDEYDEPAHPAADGFLSEDELEGQLTHTHLRHVLVLNFI